MVYYIINPAAHHKYDSSFVTAAPELGRGLIVGWTGHCSMLDGAVLKIQIKQKLSLKSDDEMGKKTPGRDIRKINRGGIPFPGCTDMQ